MDTAEYVEFVERLFHDWHYDHPRILYALMRSLKPEVAVEIGTFRGYGAAYMARALQENKKGRLFCIDDFSLTFHTAKYGDAREHLMSNLRACQVADVVTVLDGKSDAVQWPETVGFAYIDGWHSYLAARHDFDKCAALGAECICLDDTVQSVGPRMLVKEIRDGGEWDVVDLLRDCGLTICMRRIKKGPITFSQEMPGHIGHDLQTFTKQEQMEHFAQASAINGITYDPIIGDVCEGRKPCVY